MAFVPSSFHGLRLRSIQHSSLLPLSSSPTNRTCIRRPRCEPLCTATPKPKPSQRSTTGTKTKTTTESSDTTSIRSIDKKNIPDKNDKNKDAAEGEQGEYYESSKTYLLSLGLSHEDTSRVLSRLPKLSEEKHLSKVCEPMINYLRGKLRLTKKQTTQAIRFAPQILFRKIPPEDSTFTSRLEFLESVARIPLSLRSTAISKCPHILWMNLEEANKVIETIINACPLISPASLGIILSKVPQALIFPYEKIHDNLVQIRNIGGIYNQSSMARIIIKLPLSLIYNSNNTIQKKIEYLSNELNLPISTIGKVLIAIPQILQWSIPKILKPRIQLLKSIIGSTNYNDLISTIDKVPMILAYDDILDRVVWLRESIGLSDEQIRLIVIEAPAVLTYSVVGNLAPKWAFISETMGGTAEDIVAVPREALCANLQQRAMPRYAFLASMGRHNKVSVVDMLKASDVDFCRHVAQCDPAHFREYVDNDTYLLFFSQLI